MITSKQAVRDWQNYIAYQEQMKHLDDQRRQCRTPAELTWEDRQYNDAQGSHFNLNGWGQR
jgi:hypothetical protein